MDNDPDLYEDLPDFHAPDYIAKLETKIEVLEKRVKQLELALSNSEHEKRNILINNERDKRNLLNSNENLLVNVSTLFKTAKKEIERKDNTIKELREQLDDFVFRRHRKPWAPQNDAVQSQNEDDAICIKPVTENSNAVASIIRPNTKNLHRNDREKRSNSKDKSPSLTRLNTNHHEYPDEEKHNDLTRVKYLERSSLERKPKDFNDVKCSNVSLTSSNIHREEHYVNKNSSEAYHHRKTDRKIRNGDSLNRDRVDSKSKDRQRYSSYEHRKDEHDRSRHKSHKHDRDHKNEDPLKPRLKRSSADRNQSRHEFDDGYRISKDDFRRLDVDYGGRKSYDHRKKVYSSRNGAEFDDRRSDSEFGSRKSYEGARGHDHRIDPTFPPLKSTMERRKEDPVYSSRMGVDNRRSIEFSNRPNDDERRRDEALGTTCRNPIDNRLRNNVNRVSQKSSADEARRRSGSRSMTEERKHDTSNLSDKSVNSTAADDNPDYFIKNLNDKYKKSNDLEQDKFEGKRCHGSGDSDRHPSQEHHLNAKHSPASQSQVRSKKSKPLHTSPAVDVPTESSEPLSNCTSRHKITQLPIALESRLKPTEIPRTTPTASPNHLPVDVPSNIRVRRYKQSNSMKSSLNKKSKVAVNQTNSEVPLKAVGSQPKEASSQRTELSSSPPHEICSKKAKLAPSASPSTVPVKSANPLANVSSQAIRRSPPEMEELRLHSAKMSQNSPIPSEECNQPVNRDGPMQALKILAQYSGIHATPFKEVLSGDKCLFTNSKLSPISATPDYMKSLLYDTKSKVSPIPMLNERRVLDGFNSPIKKPAAPTEEPTKENRESTVIAENSTSSDEKLNDRPPGPDDQKVANPNPRKSLQLNTVVTSPFKNCCIVKVQAETVNNTNEETDDKVQSTVASGTDTSNAEHGVFNRKRRGPVKRHLRKSES